MKRRPLRELEVAALLLLLPLLAHSPLLLHDRLLGPGDGAALHFPLRAEVWDAWRRGELPSWNRSIFAGTPLLAAYRPGALYPLMLALSPFDAFDAFQALVLFSLSAAAILTFFYLRRLGAGLTGSYLAGLAFALGPYLAGHLGSTDVIVAAPLLPLCLLAAESHMNRGAANRAAGLSAAVALLLLSGSPTAVRAAGALLVGRLLLGHLRPQPGGPSPVSTARALLLGVGLSAPQWLPTLLALTSAGRQVTGLAETDPALPGFAGLILRTVSHTPAGALALAALPLVLTHLAVRVLGLALFFCMLLQWGRGPLSEPGALALTFDFALAVLAGLSLSVQWRARLEPLGQRLRAYFLFSAIASAAALSVAAAALGPLPEELAGAVGVLTFSLILYFALARHRDPLIANVWLLPLTVSFLLQPHGRGVGRDAPTRAELFVGTATRRSVEAAMGEGRSQPTLALVRHWPGASASLDLGYGGLARFTGRRSANGYDPMVPLPTRAAFEGMGPDGALRGAFFRTAPARLEALGVAWVEVESQALTSPPDLFGLGERLDLPIDSQTPRFFPLPLSPTTEVRLATYLSDAVEVEEGAEVASIEVRLASGRTLPLSLRAGEHTAEWAHDRPDVRSRVRHSRAPVLESWPGEGDTFLGYRYLALLPLPGRFLVDGIRVTRAPGRFRLDLSRLSLHDQTTGRYVPVSLSSAYVSELNRFREIAATPGVRLFALPGSLGAAAVVPRVRLVSDEKAVLAALADPASASFDPRREALVSTPVSLEAPAVAGSRRADLARAAGSRLEVRAEGPGLLVLAESWDPGWGAELDGAPAPVIRANHSRLGVALQSGRHRISLVYRTPGWRPGLALFALSLALAAAPLVRAGLTPRNGPR